VRLAGFLPLIRMNYTCGKDLGLNACPDWEIAAAAGREESGPDH